MPITFDIRKDLRFIEGINEGKLEGKAEGRLEGKAEGRLEGRLEGKAEGLRLGIIKLLEKGRLSVEEIADTFEVDVEYVREIGRQIKG